MEEIDTGWQTIEGKAPTLLVASHNFPQLRENVVKPADLGTGTLVRKMCDKHSCWGLVSTRIQPDPNWYEDSQFRQYVLKTVERYKIKVIIDIHGKRLDNPYFLMFYPNSAFSVHYGALLTGQVTKSFKDNEQVTLVEHLDRFQIPGVEIEIREDGRVPTINPEIYVNISRLLDLFVAKFSN